MPTSFLKYSRPKVESIAAQGQREEQGTKIVMLNMPLASSPYLHLMALGRSQSELGLVNFDYTFAICSWVVQLTIGGIIGWLRCSINLITS